MIRKLRTKLVLASMASLFFVLFIIVGIAGIFSYKNVLSKADETIALLIENDDAFPDEVSELENRKFSLELPYESRFFLVVFTNDGDVSSVNTGKIAAVDTSEAISYGKSVLDKGRTSGFADDYRYAVYEDSDGIHVLFLDCQRELESFKTFVSLSLIAALLGMVAVLLLLILLSARIVKPFQANYEKQKRFITDAGHELKTPLTIIEADATVLQMDMGESEWIDDIRSQTKRLSDLTNNLIYLSRMEEEQPQTEMIEFPLSDMVTETVDEFQALAKTGGKTLISDIQPMISMTGDEKSLRRLLIILLDNAMKYSKEDGEIEVSLSKQKNQIILNVYNTAEHMPKDSIAHLFDRFYRTDESRNSQTGGYGLGLSIAAAIVNTHKGKISATTQDERSLNITVFFSK